jgi:hypothetical protein
MALDPSISAALASLQARRDAIDRAVSALLALDDGDDVGTATDANEIARFHHTPAPNPNSPQASVGGGAAGAGKVLRDSPRQGFTAAQLAEAMRENGWVTPSKNPRAAARAGANRLREDPDQHVFFEDGKFVYRPPSDEQGLDVSTREDGGL